MLGNSKNMCQHCDLDLWSNISIIKLSSAFHISCTHSTISYQTYALASQKWKIAERV